MRKGNLKPFGMRLPLLFYPARSPICVSIFSINIPYPAGGVVDQHVGDGANELAVPDDGRARHECGQVGTTVFTKIS